MYEDLVGTRYGRLEVLEDGGQRASNGTVILRVKCDCGREDAVRVKSLINGKRICCLTCMRRSEPAEVERTIETIQSEHESRSRVKTLERDRKILLEELSKVKAQSKVAELFESVPESTHPIERKEITSGVREATAVICCSDWHCGEVVDPSKVHFKNRFDLEIFYRRVKRLFDGAQWLIYHSRGMFQIRDVILWLGGDLITGFIHEEFAETAETHPTLASRIVYGVLVDGIQQLLSDEKIETLSVLCNHGNHGRTTQKKRISTGAENSFEHLMYLFLADRFSDDDRVRFTVSRGDHIYLDIYDLKTRWLHGDCVSYNKGIGGVTVPLNRAILRWTSVENCNLTVLGHFHQYSSGPKTVVNGSLVGYNEYALHGSYEYEPPQQGFFVIDSRRGKCLSTPIWVSDSDDEVCG